MVRQCPRCGAGAVPGQTFCVQCGVQLGGSGRRSFRRLLILVILLPVLLAGGVAAYFSFRITTDPEQVVGKWKNCDDYSCRIYEFFEDGAYVVYDGLDSIALTGRWKFGRGDRRLGDPLVLWNENFKSTGSRYLGEWTDGEILIAIRSDRSGFGYDYYHRVDPPGQGRSPRPLRELVLSEPTVTPVGKLDPSAIPAVYYYGFNTQKAPFDNRLVRQAFWCLVRKPLLVDLAPEAGAQPAGNFVPPQLYSGSLGLNIDCGRAIFETRDFFEQAGYVDGGFTGPTKIVFEVDQDHLKTAEYVRRVWQSEFQVGINLVSRDEVSRGNHSWIGGAPQIFGMEWVAEYNDPINFLRDTFHSRSPYNDPNFSSPTYDRLVDAASVETDEATRNELLEGAQELLLSEAVVIPVYHYTVSK